MALRQRHDSLGARPAEGGFLTPTSSSDLLSETEMLSLQGAGSRWAVLEFCLGTLWAHSSTFGLTYWWPHRDRICPCFCIFPHFTFSFHRCSGPLPSKDMTILLSPEPVHVTLFGNRVFAEGIKLRILRWEHPRLSVWALNLKISFLIKSRRGEDTDRRRQCDQKAETGVMLPQAKECWQPPEGAREDYLLEPLEGAQPCWHFDFWPLDICCFRPLVDGILLKQPQETNTLVLWVSSGSSPSSHSRPWNPEQSRLSAWLPWCFGLTLLNDPWTLSIRITLELGRNADSQAPTHTHWTRICVVTRSSKVHIHVQIR